VSAEVDPSEAETPEPAPPGDPAALADTVAHEPTTTPKGPPLPEAGQRLGPYLLLNELGQGGMGVVFRAYDPRLRRSVALKVVRPELSRESRARFLEEAQVTAQLQHPVIIPVHEVGEVESRVYYTMPLVRGRAFDELLAESGPSERFRNLQIFARVCRAVEFAHERGVLHRDLKPENVMVGEHGQVYVLDWGLAMLMPPSSGETSGLPEDQGELSEADTRRLERVYVPETLRVEQQGEVVGTPLYMAPEQADGDLSQLGPQTDVYCLGGILFRILTNAYPRGGTVSEVIRDLTRGREVAPPRSIDGRVSPVLDALCMRALAVDPEQRLASAAELADRVEAFTEGRTLAPSSDDDAEFLVAYSAQGFRRPSVTIDVALVREGPSGIQLALYKRTRPPQEGAWALPGSFLDLEESLPAAVDRVLRERLGAPRTRSLIQLQTFGSPHRDPRTRVITVLYLAHLDGEVELPEGCAWFPLAGVFEGVSGGLAFDHAELVESVRESLA
jgi:serine/threonine protein kinase